MTDRRKIITIYVVVAILSTVVLTASFWLREVRNRRFNVDFDNVRIEKAEDFGSLEKDLKLTNQSGAEVTLSALKDKVWVATNFFASCPYCLETASEDLKNLYQEFGANPDFHIVSITINPEHDGAEQLRAYADHMEADDKNWWFVRGGEQEVRDYLEKEMGFLRVVKNPPESKDLFSHDRALLVFDGWDCVKKRDLQFARTKGETAHASYYQEVRASIMKSLAKEADGTESP